MLERNGIKPVIFEKRRCVGDRFINSEAFLSILTRPVADPIQYFSDKYQLYLKPVSPITSLHLFSNKSKTVIEQPVGFINIRGRHRQSFEMQLAEQTSSNIHFHSKHTYEQLANEYSHVILATGDAEYAIRMNNYQESVSVTLKGATVKGHFDRYSVYIWLDHDLAPKGYSYLLPFSEKEANIVTAYPDWRKESNEEMNDRWLRFYERIRSHLNQSLKITDQFQITNYKIGICKQPRIGNTLFTGNCFGSIMPFLGFGQFDAILTGIYAAYDLIGYGSYHELTKPLRKSYQDSLALRRGMELLDNHHLDFIVRNFDRSIVQKLVKPSHLNPLSVLSQVIKPFVKQ